MPASHDAVVCRPDYVGSAIILLLVMKIQAASKISEECPISTISGPSCACTSWAACRRRAVTLRISPAVTSSRISQLEDHLSVRLFQRTTRSLTPTEQGRAFYSRGLRDPGIGGKRRGAGGQHHRKPQGLALSSPRHWGLDAASSPRRCRNFLKLYPEVSVRLRLTDRRVDLTTEGLDLAFFPWPARGQRASHTQDRRCGTGALRRA